MIILLFIFGLLFGSFINAWVWRVKTKRPILNDRSMCPNCKHRLAARDLVPVFSWLWLRGRCRYCKKPISIQYPFVELLTALLFSISFLVFAPEGTEAWLLFALWLGQLTVLIALSVYDLRWMILPNKMLLVLTGFATLQIALKIYVSQSSQPLADAAVGALVAGGFFYLLFALSKGKWMGGGDVKLAFVMGLILGLRDVLIALMIGFNVAAIISVGLIASKRLSRKSLIPFGPFLILGTVLASLWGEDIFIWYKSLFIS